MSGRPGDGSEKAEGVLLAGEDMVARAARASLEGKRRGLRGLWPFLGPAFIAAVAYIDPGNFATNVSGGVRFGYTLLWVVVLANLMAMLVQALSAKLGIATGKNLPEVCRERFSRPATIFMWLQAEVVAMATDLAEFIGAAIGINLIFGIPLFVSGLITAGAVFALLALEMYGVRPVEAAISVLVGVIVVAFAFEVFYAKPDVGQVLEGAFIPRFSGSGSVFLATGIIGATVMPHVIYLHSALTQRRVVGRTDEEKRKIFRFELIDVVIALGIAGLVNASMMIIFAALFHARGKGGVTESIESAFHGLASSEGMGVAIIFGVALLASGLSSSSVGTMAGQVVMQGFIRRRIPIFLRRAITVTPSLVVIALGVDPSWALVVSQVVLSFGIPFALVPLLVFTSDRRLMGPLVNRRATSVAAVVIAVLIMGLNLFLLYQTFLG